MALAPTSLLSAVQPASSAMASPPTQILCTNQADEPQRRSPNLQLNLSIWLLAGLALVFLVLRLWSKFLRRRKLWWDDYLLVAAWVRERKPTYPFVRAFRGETPNAALTSFALGRSACLWAVY